MEHLKVSSKSSPSSVAGAIAGMVKDGKSVQIQCVGAGAVNQSVKAIAIARGFLAPVGIEIATLPSFADILINGEPRTAIHLAIVKIDVTAVAEALPGRGCAKDAQEGNPPGCADLIA